MMRDIKPSFWEAFRVWAKIGFLSFGGPAGQIALMHRVVVDEKKWVSEPQFLHALNFCMLLPGPEAQQLATYIGWLLHRAWGGVVAGLLFILPGFLLILGLATVYALWREVPLIGGIFYGLQAAVLAIVAQAVVRVAKRAIKTRLLLGIAALSFIAIFAIKLPFPLIILAAALAGWLIGRSKPESILPGGIKADADVLPSVPPTLQRNLIILMVFALLWGLPVLGLHLLYGESHVLSRIAVFFSEMAVVTFGGAYAVLAYVGQQAVQAFGWLSPAEMVDGLGLAETTPGPLILVLTFVGYLASFRLSGIEPQWLGGLIGGTLATWVTFVPCFLWIFLGAPYVERLRHVAALNHALTAITAAVVGVILNLAVWFGLHVVFKDGILDWGHLDITAAIMSVIALVAALRFNLGLGWLLSLAAIIGVAVKHLL
ncbi:chromate efflux transporter [Ferrovibrio sp. MS7]|uniref:chromate efflux transporter n=1 Tax=Ferrovibrio plantarum TaxID=3119164 RepID=UPI00313538B5